MIISNNSNNQYNNTSFKARSIEIKKTGDICRRVMNEFPVIYSDTKLEKYSTKNKRTSFKRLIKFSSDLVSDFRAYFDIKNLNKSYFREIIGMKKHKTGNCHELADITYMALKLNGYKDVKQLLLYAYKPGYRSLRDLDHVVVGINFRIPPNYKYKKGDAYLLNSKYRIYPQRDSIVVDSWAGFSEYAQNLSGDNWCKYDRKDLLLGLTGDKKVKSLLRKGEKLCYVPLEEKKRVPEGLIPIFRRLFPQLSLSEKFGADNKEMLNLELEGVGLKASKIRRLKKKHKLKSSNPKPSVFDKMKDYIKDAALKIFSF